MSRDEMFAAVRNAIVEELQESAEEHGLESYEEAAEDAASAATLADLGSICVFQASWDWPLFFRYVLAHSGWNHEDIMIQFTDDWGDDE